VNAETAQSILTSSRPDLASSIALLELAGVEAGGERLAGAKALLDMQCILNARAAAAAATAATAAR